MRGKEPFPPGGAAPALEIVAPMCGDKNHVGIDREHAFVRRIKVTDAASNDGAQVGAVLDLISIASAVWVGTVYRSAANIEMPKKRSLKL